MTEQQEKLIQIEFKGDPMFPFAITCVAYTVDASGEMWAVATQAPLIDLTRDEWICRWGDRIHEVLGAVLATAHPSLCLAAFTYGAWSVEWLTVAQLMSFPRAEWTERARVMFDGAPHDDSSAPEGSEARLQ